MTFTAYHQLSDIHGFLDYLAQTYPSLCKVYVIGSSVQGRPLKVLRISNGDPRNKAVWVDGGMHAREWITPATVAYIINHLVLNFDAEPKAVQGIDWYFLPVANPDGYEYTRRVDRLWRKNRARSGQCPGTDLNRNFGYGTRNWFCFKIPYAFYPHLGVPRNCFNVTRMSQHDALTYIPKLNPSVIH